MGIPAHPLAPLLSPVQARLLATLFTQPDRQFQSAELIRLVGAGTGATHRQLQQLTTAGLLKASAQGSQKFFQANRDSPIFAELRSMILKTVGLVHPLREALQPLRGEIDTAFIFGSMANGTATAESDVDLLVLSDTLDYTRVFEILQPVEQIIGRRINPTMMIVAEWRQKLTDPDSFASRISAAPNIGVIGSGDGGAGA